jgi:hypothetical protein
MPDAQIKNENAELRSSARIEHASPLQIKDVHSGNLHRAKMLNYSSEGLYFESDSMLNPGMKIYLGIKNSPYADMPDVLEYRRGEILWRRKLKDSFYQFGYGVKICPGGKTIARPKDAGGSQQDQRRHPRKACLRSTSFATQGARFKGEIKNVSLSGLFISSQKALAIDQTITLSIPSKHGKEVMITGQVAWTNSEGCGIRIQRIEKVFDTE